MNQYIVPLPPNDPRLFSHVSHAFSLVDLGKRLLDAAKNGDVEELENLMHSGAPFTTDWLGISPLHFAAMNGHLTSCEALLNAGICRDARTKVDRTPLHLAAQEGHADIVELLLRNGAEIEAVDMLRMTALHWAAERGHTPVVQMLMKFGANPKVQNKFEMTPVEIAESKGHIDARDAMMNCSQYDIGMSSVGQMAASNGGMASTNAYILTEEETLVPAAPPADEVVVTATSVDDLNVEKSNNSVVFRSDSEMLCQPSSEKILYENSHNLQFNCYDHTANHTEESDQDFIENCQENRGRDVMLVETPDGELLYVRQMADTTGPEGIAIFTRKGKRISDPALMTQVVEALNSMEEENTTPKLQSSTECQLESGGVATSNMNCKASKRPFMETPSPSHQGKRTRNCIRPRAIVNTSLNQSSSRAFNSEDDSGTLLVQLTQLSEGRHPHGRSLCVEGVGVGASVQELCDWFLYNGIFVQTISSGPDFIVDFIYERKAHKLMATYDKHAGTLTFSSDRLSS